MQIFSIALKRQLDIGNIKRFLWLFIDEYNILKSLKPTIANNTYKRATSCTPAVHHLKTNESALKYWFELWWTIIRCSEISVVHLFSGLCRELTDHPSHEIHDLSTASGQRSPTSLRVCEGTSSTRLAPFPLDGDSDQNRLVWHFISMSAQVSSLDSSRVAFQGFLCARTVHSVLKFRSQRGNVSAIGVWKERVIWTYCWKDGLGTTEQWSAMRPHFGGQKAILPLTLFQSTLSVVTTTCSQWSDVVGSQYGFYRYRYSQKEQRQTLA